MAKYTIKELYAHYTDSIRPVVYNECFLGGRYWRFNPTDPETETDTRPNYLKAYADVYGVDAVIVSKYGDYVYNVDCDTVANAWNRFTLDNEVFRITHNTELSMIYKAFTTDFNPLENYDRIESTSVSSSSTSGATSKTAPDDSETFYNVGSADSSASGTNITASRVHGNIGVTQATDMIKNTVQYFNSNAYIDVFIDRVIRDNCFMVDYGYNII